MKKNPHHVITEPTIPAGRVVSNARLLWIGLLAYGDSYVLKDGIDSTRQTFCEAICRAEKRLWILDKKFDSITLSAIWHEIYGSRIPDIRIFAEKKQIDNILSWFEDQRRIRREILTIDGYRVTWKTPQQSELRHTTFTTHPRQLHRIQLQSLAVLTKVHDRFALIDDELWHFGGTVGVLEDQGLCAVSRGWYAEAEQFVRIFTQCLWREK